jgi:hypothetical protein
MRATFLGMVILITGVFGCGASSLAKIGYKTMRGVDADVIALEPIPAGALDAYHTIQVGHVTTDVPQICRAPLLDEVKTQFKAVFDEQLSEAFPGRPRSLTVDVSCRYYRKKSPIGSEGRLDVLVYLRDTMTTAPIGRFFIEGITESPLHTGMDDMAEGVAKEVADYLEERKAPEEGALEPIPEPSTQPAGAVTTRP